MKIKPEVEKKYLDINAITANWQQGDNYLGDYDFYFRANPDHHIVTSEKLSSDDVILSQNIVGFCVVSQTCDIVRCCKSRPYIEISPLVEVSGDELLEIAKGGRPNYGYLPGLKNQKLVADLDRVLTIEKSCLKTLSRTAAFTSDSERKSFAKALSRKRARFAFPNDFRDLVAKLRDRILRKHEKASDEGVALNGLRQIRVAASPSWADNDIHAHFYFVKNSDDKSFDDKKWEDFHQSWIKLVDESGRYKQISSELTNLEIMSAKEYEDSDPLDLEHLSGV